MLAATTPELSDQFDWRLRLRLNHALTAAAREAAASWPDRRVQRGAWLQRFGFSAAMGLAAVLGLALFADSSPDVGAIAERPAERESAYKFLVPTAPSMAGGQAALGSDAYDASDRRSLTRFMAPGGGSVRTVAQRDGSPAAWSKSGRETPHLNAWTGDDVQDLETITDLRERIESLEIVLGRYERENSMLKARLDTSRVMGLDLRRSR